jgi:hypothetical protein
MKIQCKKIFIYFTFFFVPDKRKYLFPIHHPCCVVSLSLSLSLSFYVSNGTNDNIFVSSFIRRKVKSNKKMGKIKEQQIQTNC